jgi:valyl-tRNA synthetase
MLPNAKGRLISARYPEWTKEREAPDIQAHFEALKEIVTLVRTLRSEFQISPEASIPLSLAFDDGYVHAAFIQEHVALIRLLAGASSVSIGQAGGAAAPEGTVSLAGKGLTIHVQVGGLLDIGRLVERLSKDKEKELAYIAKLETKLSNSAFLSSAPPDIIEKEKEKLAASKTKAAKLDLYIRELS